jgi:hypothetical protein
VRRGEAVDVDRAVSPGDVVEGRECGAEIRAIVRLAQSIGALDHIPSHPPEDDLEATRLCRTENIQQRLQDKQLP